MPRDFKSFAEKNHEVEQENKDKLNEYQEILDKYKDLDRNSLLSQLMKEAARLKSEGKLDEKSLMSLKNTIEPFLNAEQKEMLEEIIKMLK